MSRDLYKKLEIEDDTGEDELVLTLVMVVSQYYMSYIHKQPCMTSAQTGYMWLMELIRGHEKRCFNMFRMDKFSLLLLCNVLETRYGLEQSKKMTTVEKTSIFLFAVALGASNRQMQERFQRSGETISRNFHEVLKALLKMAVDLIKPSDPTFSSIPSQILQDKRYMPYFKDCIGAIDGTHVAACVNQKDTLRFIGRKGTPTQNIMAICDFDMKFTFVLAGWEGSAHDSRIFEEARTTRKYNFPHPPPGKYYLVDAGYPQLAGFLRPYKNTTYHLPDFRRQGEPTGPQETFNRWHSSLRGCIERTFGVWKARFRIFRMVMPPYSFSTQRNIVVATMTLHNFIRRNANIDDDPIIRRFEQNPNFIPIQEDDSLSDEIAESGRDQMNILRDQIAASMMERRN